MHKALKGLWARRETAIRKHAIAPVAPRNKDTGLRLVGRNDGEALVIAGLTRNLLPPTESK